MIPWLVCFFRGFHRPVRRPVIGGFSCEDCGRAESDALGYVNVERLIYTRESQPEFLRGKVAK